MSDNFSGYYRHYVKGRPKGVVRLKPIELHHHIACAEEGERYVLLTGFDKWWHVRVRLPYEHWRDLPFKEKAWYVVAAFTIAGGMAGIVTCNRDTRASSTSSKPTIEQREVPSPGTPQRASSSMPTHDEPRVFCGQCWARSKK